MEPQNTSKYVLPAAILVGFGIIASVIFFSDNTGNSRAVTGVNQDGSEDILRQPVSTVTEDDKVRGNPNAPMMFVTYMDYDCASCKSYYYAMDRLVREQGIDGLVGWSFRPLPTTDDTTVLEAAYCAEEQNDKDFWRFSDIVFDARDTLAAVDQSSLSEYAEKAGLSVDAFENCRNNQTYKPQIDQLANEVALAGGMRPPFTVVMFGDEQEAFYGSQTFSTLNQIMNSVRAEVTTE